MKIYFLSPFLILFLILLSCSPEHEERQSPIPTKGNLDLSDWNFVQNGPVAISGQWEFYWKKFVNHSDLKKGISINHYFLDLPCTWNNQVLGKKKLSGSGYGTHRIKVKINRKDKILAFKLQDMATAYKLFINNKLIAENGSIGKSADSSVPQFHPQVAIFNPPDEEFDLILQVSNFHHRLGGPWFPILLGTEEQIREIRERKINLDLFLFGSLFIMGLYHLGLFVLRRNDRSPLYFCLFTLLMAIRILVQGEHYLVHLFTNINFALEVKLNYLTFYLGVPVFSTFVHSIFPQDFSKRILLIINSIFGIFSAIVIFTPVSFFTYTFFTCEILTLICCLYISYIFIKAVNKKRDEALVFLVAWLFLFLTIVNDMLYGHFLLGMDLSIPIGFFIFIFAQAFLLSKRFSRAFIIVAELSNSLEDKNKELLRLDKLKDQFLANTTHELNTPLNGITGIAESLIDGASGPLPDQTVKNLLMIVNSGKRLSGLINDLLDFSKLKNNDLILHLKPVDIKSTVDSVIEITRPLIGSKNLEVINQINQDIPEINADDNRIQQILINLISNSIKFTESGTVSITAHIIELEGVKFLTVTVADTGIGIQEDKLQLIFAPFEQGDGTIGRNFGGTGIGLTITRELIELHGGTISVKSVFNQGSAFTFQIPYNKKDSTAQEQINKVNNLPKQQITEINEDIDEIYGPSNSSIDYTVDLKEEKPKILIVDDDPINLQVLENHLFLQNYLVYKSFNGEEALKEISNGLNPDLVLLDIMMPKISGYDVSRQIRKNHSLYELPIMMLTAKNRSQDIVAGFMAGANDYLPKPFNKNELLARVKTLITLKHAVSESKKLSALKEELEIARRIQQSIIPSSIPAMTHLKLAIKYIPMERIGGDFYNFHMEDENRIGILIADVTGHGIPAALVASMAKIVSTLLENIATDPVEYLSEMDRILTVNCEDQFLTAGYLFIDTKKMKLTFARAGHEPLLVYKRKEGKLYEYLPKGRFIGFKNEIELGLSTVDIEKGDRIILYTDCLTEAFNSEGNIFGFNAFKERIVKKSNLSPNDFADDMVNHLKNWSDTESTFDDDLTLIVIDVSE